MEALEAYLWEDREIIEPLIRQRFEAARAGVRKDRYKRYEVRQPDGGWRRATGVTTAIGVLDKPALVKWSANVQYDADVSVAWRLYREGCPAQLTREQFTAMFAMEAGKEREHQKILKEAADLGTQVHALIEHAVRQILGQQSEEPRVSDEALFVFAGWEAWAKSVDFRPVATEFTIFSCIRGYAGTPDVLAWVDHVLKLVDWKTSGGLYLEHEIQNVAYRQALVDMGVLVHDVPGLLVRIPKGQDDAQPFETHEVGRDRHPLLLRVFEDCLSLYPTISAESKASLERWKAKKRAEEARARAA